MSKAKPKAKRTKKPKKSPSEKGEKAEARDGKTGRFVKGHCGGPGNPHGRRVQALRSALMSAVTEEDIIEITHKLVDMSKEGNVKAIKELLDRLLGKPKDAPDPEEEKTPDEWREVYVHGLGYSIKVPPGVSVSGVAEELS